MRCIDFSIKVLYNINKLKPQRSRLDNQTASTMKKEIKIRISTCLNYAGNHCFKVTDSVTSEIRWIFPGLLSSGTGEIDINHPKLKELCLDTLKEVITGIKVQGECSFKVEYSDKYMSVGEITSHDHESIKFSVPHNDLVMPMSPEHILLFHELLSKI